MLPLLKSRRDEILMWKGVNYVLDVEWIAACGIVTYIEDSLATMPSNRIASLPYQLELVYSWANRKLEL